MGMRILGGYHWGRALRQRSSLGGMALLATLSVQLTGCANHFPVGMLVRPLQRSESLPIQSDAPLVQMVHSAQKKHQHARAQSGGSAQNHSEHAGASVPPTERANVMDSVRSNIPSVEDSAVYPLANGVEAFAARSALIKNAQYSLDLQYYNMEKGLSTRLLLREIVAAAERGVRVRVLLDDREQLGRDKEMLILNAHPNIEVRVFNPIKKFRANLVTRWAVFLSNLSTLRRRMHIKMWLADGVLGITGGRNLSDRYFNAGEEDNFSDMDVLLAGRAVTDMQHGFDAYWNSAQVMAVDDFDGQYQSWRRDQIAKMLLSTSRLTRKERVQRHPYLQVLKQTEDTMLSDVVAKMTWGKVAFLMDPPDKITRAPEPPTISLSKEGVRRDTPVFDRLIEAMGRAKNEVLVVSPYFLPGDELTDFLIQLRERGVRVVLLSNSLQSNDVPVIHGHYDYYRDRLLAGGVEVYELRGYPDVAPEPQWRHPIFSIRGSRTALHSKVVVIDGQESFVGSMNLDHCSVTGNTEAGVLIEQQSFSQQLRQLVLNQLNPRFSFQLRQDAQGKTYWFLGSDSATDEAGGTSAPSGTKITREPGSFWRKLQKQVGAWLPEHYM